MKQGPRVKFSEKGVEALTSRRSTAPLLLSEMRGYLMLPEKVRGYPITQGCVRVKWDHKKYLETLHESFVEIVDEFADRNSQLSAGAGRL